MKFNECTMKNEQMNNKFILKQTKWIKKERVTRTNKHKKIDKVTVLVIDIGRETKQNELIKRQRESKGDTAQRDKDR